MDEIKTILMMYPIRKVQIEDMKLKIEELEARDSLPAQGYGEKVSTSRVCRNNDNYLLEIERLEKIINVFTISNKRVENIVNLINNERQRRVVEGLLLHGKSKTQMQKEIDRSRKQVENLLKAGLEVMKNTLDELDQKIDL